MVHSEGPYTDLISSDVNVVNLRACFDPTNRLRRLLTNLRALFSLCGYIGERKPHAIVSTDPVQNVTAIMARRLAGAGCRLIITHQTTLSQVPEWFNWFIRTLLRWFYPGADSDVAASRGVAEDLVRIAPGIRTKSKVIYNPVDLDRIQRLSLEEPDHPWFKNGSHQVILGVGRLCRQKDFPTLVRAFARVRQTRPVKLVILGEGEERQRLESLVAELGLGKDVSLPGFVRNPFSYMKRSPVFALSSAFEGFSLVVAEALACGCPVVSTDCPSGPSEILEGGKWGDLVPVGDAEALAAAIERALQNPPSPDLLRQRAAFFSVDRAAEAYLDVVFAGRKGADA